MVNLYDAKTRERIMPSGASYRSPIKIATELLWAKLEELVTTLRNFENKKISVAYAAFAASLRTEKRIVDLLLVAFVSA